MIGRVWAALAELLYPSRARCAGCGDLNGTPDGWLCERCAAKYRPNYECVRDGAWPADGISAAYTAFRYDAIARGLIHTFKFRRVRALRHPLGVELAGVFRTTGMPRPDLIVPVPLHRTRLRERGFNQSALLAASLSESIGVPVRPCLIRSRRTRQQARLSAKMRHANLADAFRCAEPLNGARVLLVDDVITTGATAHQCAAALRRAGAKDVVLIAAANAYLPLEFPPNESKGQLPGSA